MERRLKRLPEEFYFFGLLPFLARLPVRTGYRIASFLGHRLALFESQACELVSRNVACVQGAHQWPPTGTIAQEVFENLIYEDLDSYHYRGWDSENIDRFFTFEGLEHLEQQMETGRGAVLMTAHVGALCAAMVALGLKGFPLTHVSREYEEDPRIPRAFRRFAIWKIRLMEEKMGFPLVNAYGQGQLQGHHSVLEILRHLDQGHFVSMALDVNPDWLPDAIEVPFLGGSGRFSPNIVRIAALAKAPLIPYFTLRDPDAPHRHRIVIQPPMPLSGDPTQDLARAVLRFEEMIIQRPDQWFCWDSLAHFMPSLPC